MEPRTAAGRRLARNLRTLNLTPPEPDDWPENDILAIEDEAAASPVDGELRKAAVEVLAADAAAESGEEEADRRWDAALDVLRAALASEKQADPGFKLSDYDPNEGVGGT